MKKLSLGLGIAALLTTASCKKETGGLAQNTWSVAGKIFTANNVDVSAASNFISASDNAGSSVDFSFKTLPSASKDLDINDVAYTNNDVAIRTVLSGNIVYNSIQSAGTFLSLRVNAGKYTLIANNIKMVNAAVAKDTIELSTYIVQP